MSRAGNCPSCGAPVTFQFAQAVQAACPYCRAILVRHDVDLEKVGEVAALPPDPSPIQLMTEGRFGNTNFTVIGRLTYEWDQGRWNEWHILLSTGATGWLSDAQAEYAVSFLTPPPAPLPTSDSLTVNDAFRWPQGAFVLTHITKARYIGFEGELPFRTDDRSYCIFADLRTVDARFATIDYSEEPPLLYIGQLVDFDSLKLTNLKQYEGW